MTTDVLQTQTGAAPPPVGDIGNHMIPLAVLIVEGVFALLAILVRLLARYMMGRLGISDILLVISLGFFLGHYENAYQAIVYPGLGVHQSQFNPELAKASHYSFVAGSVLFGLNIAFLKTAILLDWVRTFVPTGTRNALSYILWTLIWANALFYFIGTFIEAFQCPPDDGSKKVAARHCPIDAPKYNITSGIINVLSDLTILVSPHWVIWKLHMTTAQKTGVSFLFLIGILATASAVVRVYYVVVSYNTGDFLFYSLGINLWAIAEQTFGYLVLGIPSLPKIFREFRPCRSFALAFRSFSISRIGGGGKNANNNNNNSNAQCNRKSKNDKTPTVIPSRDRDRDLELGVGVGLGASTHRSRSKSRWPGAHAHDMLWELDDLDTRVLVTVDEHERDHEPGNELSLVEVVLGEESKGDIRKCYAGDCK
ncbi:hypothetical protein F5Y17DRAFT_373665 [Xylariaceae sp. FL0594]|nr:hypothetical protein F5Y17DRAFT_373665 [Xylariaceae sp. FL0594]